jgi:hypothetical protein
LRRAGSRFSVRKKDKFQASVIRPQHPGAFWQIGNLFLHLYAPIPVYLKTITFMPYARTNWKEHELKIALSNPVHSHGGPHAHSAMHAGSGELANHPLFQKARVSAEIVTGGATHRNDHFHAKGADGTWVKGPTGANLYSNSQRNNNPIPKPDASRHSVLDANFVAAALVRALNAPTMQAHLANLDAGNDMKVHVNFAAPIGRGHVHATGQASAQTDFVSLFVYCKPNPGNRDIPIFQTVVPSDQRKVGGGDPILNII